MSNKVGQRDPLMLEVVAAIGAGRIKFAPLDGDNEWIYGICESDGEITLNPIPHMCDTVVHECLHRLRPKWSETTVRRRTKMLMSQLSSPEVEKLFELTVIAAKRRQLRASADTSTHGAASRRRVRLHVPTRRART